MQNNLPSWLYSQYLNLLKQKGSAFLIQGTKGLGQFELALALIKTWLCEKNKKDKNNLENSICGECFACKLSTIYLHSDVFFVLPEAKKIDLSFPLSDKEQSELKTRKPSKEIRVDLMREAIEFSRFTSSRNLGKFIVIYPAEKMNLITANTLLKSLEEPTGETKFILVSESNHKLLPTILSRCLIHNMNWPRKDEVLNWLISQNISQDEAKICLNLAGVIPEEALKLAKNKETLEIFKNFPQLIFLGQTEILTKLKINQLLEFLQKLCHDLTCINFAIKPRFFENKNLPNPPSLEKLNLWFNFLKQKVKVEEHAFNENLMKETLITHANSVLNSAK